MIRIENLTKHFDTVCAVNHVSLTIPEGIMYGILGTNGAGKSTLLRLIAGILEPDEGRIYVDDESCYDNPSAKSCFFYLPDTPYYFANASMEDMMIFYAKQYPQMDVEGAVAMAEMLNLDVKQPIRTFSKGMKRQVFLILALCANTKYLLCDEVFDGLDSMVTEVMKNLLREAMKERKFTVVVVSHKLRELEDICGQIGILHKGGLLSSGDMKVRAENIFKFQCVLEADGNWEEKRTELEKKLNIVKCRREGSFVTLLIRDEYAEYQVGKETVGISGESSKVQCDKEEDKRRGCVSKKRKQVLEEQFPIFCKEVPMTLEETFIAEMEASGYDIRKVLF